MKKSWTTTRLITAGSLGVLATVLALAGAGIAAVTGVPGTSGFFTVLTTPIVVVICSLILNQFGAVTMMEFIHGVLEVPLPLTGAPGFLFKVPILIFSGLFVDILYLILKRNQRFAVSIIGGFYIVFGGVAVVLIGRLVNMPGVQEAEKFLINPAMLMLAFFGGAIGGNLGYIVFQKIKNTSVVKRIQGV